MNKMLTSLMIFSFFYSTNSFAFLIECKDLDNKDVEARFVQQEKNLTLKSQMQHQLFGWWATSRINMANANIVYRNGALSGFQWSNKDYSINLNISEDIIKDDQMIRPYSFRSQLVYRGSGKDIINGDNFSCRYFQM